MDDRFDTEGLYTLEREIVALGLSDDRGPGRGVIYANDVFAMAPFCWCESDECPWCVSCECPDSAYAYLVDGQEVSYEQWLACFDELTAGLQPGSRAYEQAVDRAQERRGTRHDAECEFCRTGSVAAEHGGGPGRSAPNFWHKPTGLKVWWYKHMNRGVEVENPAGVRLGQVLGSCLTSLTGPAC